MLTSRGESTLTRGGDGHLSSSLANPGAQEQSADKVGAAGVAADLEMLGLPSHAPGGTWVLDHLASKTSYEGLLHPPSIFSVHKN